MPTVLQNYLKFQPQAVVLQGVYCVQAPSQPLLPLSFVQFRPTCRSHWQKNRPGSFFEVVALLVLLVCFTLEGQKRPEEKKQEEK